MRYIKGHEYSCRNNVNKIKQYNARIFNRILNELGIESFTCEQSAVLEQLWKHNSLSCNELAEKTGLAPNTITALVSNLQKNGLVVRAASPDDRRKVVVTITDKGLSVREDFERVVEKVVNIGFAGFSDYEYSEFENYLKRLCDNYEKFFVSKKGE